MQPGRKLGVDRVGRGGVGRHEHALEAVDMLERRVPLRPSGANLGHGGHQLILEIVGGGGGRRRRVDPDERLLDAHRRVTHHQLLRDGGVRVGGRVGALPRGRGRGRSSGADEDEVDGPGRRLEVRGSLAADLAVAGNPLLLLGEIPTMGRRGEAEGRCAGRAVRGGCGVSLQGTLKQQLSQNPHISPKVGGVEWGHDASDPDYRSATRHQYPHQSASVHRA